MAKWSCLSLDLFLVFGSNPHTSHGRPVERLGTEDEGAKPGLEEFFGDCLVVGGYFKIKFVAFLHEKTALKVRFVIFSLPSRLNNDFLKLEY